MLILTRKSREAVVVGGAGGFEPLLKVTVLEIQGSKVRLGFEGEATIPIHRLEVWERLQAGNGNGNGNGNGADSTMESSAVPVAMMR